MNYNFPDHVSGDTFNGIEFQVNVNGEPKDLTGFTIKMEVKKSQVSGAALTLSTEEDINVTDGPAGRFNIIPQVITLKPGTYFYDIEFSKDGYVKTWISGQWSIINDITR